MSEELQYFYEDAKTQLDLMEQALMDIAENGSDDEAIGALFRAMHTIKGTAGMFDFSRIVSFTHIAENILDLVRHKKIDLTEEMLELFLHSKDHVQSMVEASIHGLEYNESLLRSDEELRIALSSTIETSPSMPKNMMETDDAADETSGEKVWHISLRLKEDFFKTGMDILSIFEYFSTEGDIIAILPITDSVPTIDKYDPFFPYVGFEIFFLTSNTQAQIEEIFEFVLDDIDLIIIPSDDNAALQRLLDKRPEVSDVLRGASMHTHFLNETRPPEPTIETPLDTHSIAPVVLPSSETIKTTTPPKSTFLRVDFQKIDILINQLSEMVTSHAKISQMSEKHEDSDLEEEMVTFSSMLDTFRDTLMDIRMVPVEESFAKLRRNVSDVAKKLGKSVEFTIQGGETELDKAVVEKLSDPLVHMLRNSIDHGIENVEDRIKNGKTPQGHVWLRAYPESGTIIIEIEDDGRGLNTPIIHQKAIDKGLVSPHEILSDEAINMFIFHPGFSTAEVVSDLSGRGVGMDVVKQNIESLKGRIRIENRMSQGCKFIITLPLTLAIIDGFLVQAGTTKYIIPQDSIQEVLELRSDTLCTIVDSPLLNLRGELLPILNLKDFFHDTQNMEVSRQNIVIIRYGSTRAGLIVDELFGEHQTVVKTLGPIFKNIPGLSGGSILGSGEIALICDIPSLIDFVIQNDHP